MNRCLHILSVFVVILLMSSCKKNLLSEIPSSGYMIPTTESDFTALLDNENVFGRHPVLAEASSDDYYFTADYLAKRNAMERNVYTWAKDIYAGTTGIYDWDAPYEQIQVCNIVLEGLAKLRERSPSYNTILADAIFKKSLAYYNLLQLFAPAYDTANFYGNWGIPLKNSSDVKQKTERFPLEDCYDQVINNLEGIAVLPLVPNTPNSIRSRTNRAAIFALLSRAYLSMRNYFLAGRYADSSLYLVDTLIDYNNISVSGNTPFQVRNPENLYTSRVPNNIYQCLLPMSGEANIDSGLYMSYSEGDMRKRIFFYLTNGLPRRKNFYDGTANTLYTGLAVDEMYLNIAECSVRLGNTSKGLLYLNRLLSKRMVNGFFIPVGETNRDLLLEIILKERRKELVMRGLRWTDIRRLNLEGRNIIPTRLIDGEPTQLLPNTNAYVLPIPPDVISLSGILQNPR